MLGVLPQECLEGELGWAEVVTASEEVGMVMEDSVGVVASEARWLGYAEETMETAVVAMEVGVGV